MDKSNTFTLLPHLQTCKWQLTFPVCFLLVTQIPSLVTSQMCITAALTADYCLLLQPLWGVWPCAQPPCPGVAASDPHCRSRHCLQALTALCSKGLPTPSRHWLWLGDQAKDWSLGGFLSEEVERLNLPGMIHLKSYQNYSPNPTGTWWDLRLLPGTHFPYWSLLFPNVSFIRGHF